MSFDDGVMEKAAPAPGPLEEATLDGWVTNRGTTPRETLLQPDWLLRAATPAKHTQVCASGSGASGLNPAAKAHHEGTSQP